MKRVFTIFALFIWTGAIVPAAMAQSDVDGRAYLKAGIKSIEEGKAEVAVEQITKAISSNRLSNTQIATALYQRGVAFRKSGKPGQAVTDLTGALYLQTLPASERPKAHLERARAYESLGLSTRASADIQAAGRNNSKTENASVPVASVDKDVKIRGSLPADFKTTVAKTETPSSAQKSSSSSIFPSWISNLVSPSSQPAKKKAEAVPTKLVNGSWATNVDPKKSKTQQKKVAQTSVPISGNWETDTSAPVRNAVVKKSAATPAPVNANWQTDIEAKQSSEASSSQKKNTSSGGTGVANFFQGIFQGNSGNQAKPAPQKPQVSGAAWTSETKVVSRQPNSAPRPKPAPKSTKIASRTSGKYHLQLASVQSEQEVSQVWKRLNSRYGGFLEGQQRNIQRVDLGEKGTRYRVRIGPFASKADTIDLCVNMKSNGMDCFLVIN